MRGIYLKIRPDNNEFNFEQKKIEKDKMTSLKYSPESQSNPENNFSRFNDTYFIKELLKRLDKFKDNEDISLEDSIPVLYQLNIFQELTSIPEAKKRLTQDVKPNQRLQIEARFIYNLWKLIGQEFIPMRDFKQLIMMFITEETSNLAARLEQTFGQQNQVLIQIIAIWQAMLQNNSHNSSYQQYRDSSVLTQEGNINSESGSNKHTQKSSLSYSNHNYSTNSIEPNRISLNKNGKENQRNSVTRTNQNYTERPGQKTRRENIEKVRDEIYNSQLYEIPILTVERQKQLVNRLYVVNKYERYQEIKKIQDQEKLQKQLEECTFRPNIDREKITKRPDTAGRNKTSRNQSKPIPGFQKAIERMKIGQQKTKELKEKLELRNISLKQNKQETHKVMAPPKFLNRETKREEKKVLFTIQFDIGRHKLTCKIHQNESAQQLAKNIQSIYTLKQDSYEQIKSIIEQEMERYFQLNLAERENHDEGQQNHGQEFGQHDENSRQGSQKFVFC